MIFFTDITTDASNYCLLHIDKINDQRQLNKKVVFIDPGVHYLTKPENKDYPHHDLLHKFASGELKLPKNYWISIDYPSDMFPERSTEFLIKTYTNNEKYQHNSWYINTLQFSIDGALEKAQIGLPTYSPSRGQFDGFKHAFEMNLPFFWKKKKILGIGNMCRIMYPNSFTDKVFKYLIQKRGGIWKIHIYGMAMRLIKKYGPMLEYSGIRWSTDSTKWTRCCTDNLKKQYGLNCNKSTRPTFFLEYMKQIQKRMRVIY